MENKNYEDDIELVKKRIVNKRKGIILIVSLFAVLCGIVTFFVVNHYYQSGNTISFSNYDVYQYFSGVKYNYTGKASYENDKLIGINDEGNKVEIGNTPIYYQAVDNECIIPITMGLFTINEKGKNYRINYFSKIVYEMSDKDEMSFISYNGNKKFIDNAFLYDGKNTYVFPYSVELVVEGKKYNLSPLSYVVVNYKDSVEIYIKKDDEYYFVDEIKNDVIATYNGNKINLSTDMIIYENDERLLIKSVSKLDLFE